MLHLIVRMADIFTGTSRIGADLHFFGNSGRARNFHRDLAAETRARTEDWSMKNPTSHPVEAIGYERLGVSDYSGRLTPMPFAPELTRRWETQVDGRNVTLLRVKNSHRQEVAVVDETGLLQLGRVLTIEPADFRRHAQPRVIGEYITGDGPEEIVGSTDSWLVNAAFDDAVAQIVRRQLADEAALVSA